MLDQTVTLTPHADTRGGVVRNIVARVSKRQDALLTVAYVIEADIDRLRIAPPQSPVFSHQLWQHTCCEIFITRAGHPAYHEFNFAPSGAWAAYAFARYREREPLAHEALEPRIAVRAARDRLELDAVIQLDRLSPLHAGAKLALALAVVIEDQDGFLSYWALAHPAGAPDFHHPLAFALELE